MSDSGTMLSFIIAGSLFASGLLILLSVMRAYTDSRQPDVVDLIQGALREELGEEQSKEEGSWTSYWAGLFKNTGRKFMGEDVPSRIALIVVLVGGAIGVLITPGDLVLKAFGGLAVAVAAAAMLAALLKFEGNRRQATLSKQLPLFISSMRTHLQGNTTITQSLMRSADDIPEPLYSEMISVKKDLEAGTPLAAALKRLAANAEVKELKFLISAINIAAESGSDLEPQLKKIEEIIDNRRKVTNAISAAVAEINPTRVVAATVIPGVFLWSFFSSADNRAFWGTLMGLGLLLLSVFLYVVGLIIFSVLVNNLKKGV